MLLPLLIPKATEELLITVALNETMNEPIQVTNLSQDHDTTHQ